MKSFHYLIISFFRIWYIIIYILDENKILFKCLAVKYLSFYLGKTSSKTIMFKKVLQGPVIFVSKFIFINSCVNAIWQVSHLHTTFIHKTVQFPQKCLQAYTMQPMVMWLKSMRCCDFVIQIQSWGDFTGALNFCLIVRQWFRPSIVLFQPPIWFHSLMIYAPK